jgi:hypothetical protein
MSKENDEHDFEFARLFRPRFLGFLCTAHAFFAEHLLHHCQGLRSTFSEIFTKYQSVRLSDPSRNRIRSDARLHIKGRKNRHANQDEWNVVH